MPHVDRVDGAGVRASMEGNQPETDVGTNASGQAADLVLFDGDPFEYTPHTCTVMDDGRVVSDECK